MTTTTLYICIVLKVLSHLIFNAHGIFNIEIVYL